MVESRAVTGSPLRGLTWRFAFTLEDEDLDFTLEDEDLDLGTIPRSPVSEVSGRVVARGGDAAVQFVLVERPGPLLNI